MAFPLGAIALTFAVRAFGNAKRESKVAHNRHDAAFAHLERLVEHLGKLRLDVVGRRFTGSAGHRSIRRKERGGQLWVLRMPGEEWWAVAVGAG